MSRGENSQGSYHAIAPACVDIVLLLFPWKRNIVSTWVSTFPFSIYMEGNQTRFVEPSGSDIKELVANAFPKSTKSLQNILSMS